MWCCVIACTCVLPLPPALRLLARLLNVFRETTYLNPTRSLQELEGVFLVAVGIAKTTHMPFALQ